MNLFKSNLKVLASPVEVATTINAEQEKYNVKRGKVIEMAEYFCKYNWDEDQPRSQETYTLFVETCFALAETFWNYASEHYPEMK